MEDLYNVGKTKSLGYLPINTIIDCYHSTLREVYDFARENNLRTLLLKSDECEIWTGALYVYDEQWLMNLLKQYKFVFEQAKVPIYTCELYIRHISNCIVSDSAYPEAYIAIGKTFGDPRFE